ncbi:MAG: 2-succinyl-5-enolpyruvyl-6-hydroxy-3-cyclohexene-1-carboxylic-acid synthase [Salibacteraceae bacterium]|jgi:2-succinyl-5-enolpyruvyl-6-hydroxy-3-cyclohexene-1-carboxylate synthase|nr:2-succinyl-5-enolpyruvyl-6-hydroxy-3-cyclohexene-1-carboxylic-acid synthase [Salibacteraceae bacterium]MDP4687180.1 2-succinyl-5-enolpyruvyl-6-hydroxy-3-cyclohexene-1-carboxylic-acid synthase [Salibacteraceae bacterium]MDP4763789.1 2-succinyl-5-enolpyruvyl-6-hydroxy-3-cyclohexene-1-carboxylic-acid synthase [Salibacteraceae bacterium]MDP4845242.1 2-succinyl-5-enolpyruvyl-6-hydroxy-3-cyclohexene-1-carboxylic-acid synthase [Salibacteraceae bacterium]MDP4963610.1 2-succinyl-5-enolpyruvyl-6-hydro
MTEISSIPSVRSVVQIALHKQITDIVLSPGSRNAPFILSFSAIEAFHCLSVLDERSAGFIALGMAQQKRKPVMLSCTSGSAMINYAPAMVEAFYQNIPLIAITADRPTEWIDQGEGQSIRQTSLVDGVFIKNFNLVWAKDADDIWYNERLINEAFETALAEQKPVQINVPLREPLYETSALSENDKPHLFQRAKRLFHVEAKYLGSLQEKWFSAPSILILIGQTAHHPGLEDQLRFLMEDHRVAVVTESTSNLYQFGFVSCIDRTIDGFLGKENEVNFAPQLLITIGGNLISKKLKSFLRKHKNKIQEHWHIGAEVMDTFQSLTQIIETEPSELFRILRTDKPEGAFDFGTKWKQQFFKSEQVHLDFLAKTEYSDLKVFELLMDYIPDDAQIQMGNSSVVRYVQLFNQIRSVKYFGNRGVSGIEGCVSTAVGAAIASQDLVIHISGDHAFRYDSNALGINVLPSNLRVIVINNNGGNIFRIIEGPKKYETSETFIEKVDERSIKKLVEYHEIQYLSAQTLDEVEVAMQQLISPEANAPMVLEVFTPRVSSPEILKAYFQNIRNNA